LGAHALVNQLVICARANQQIRWRIVEPVAIDVMHDHVGGQGPPKGALRDQNVIHHPTLAHKAT
jgi:hypothetical protein